MQQMHRQMRHVLVLVIAGMVFIASPALAGKPAWAGGGAKGGKHEEKAKHSGKKEDSYGHSREHHGDDDSVHFYFGKQHREVIRTYYKDQFRAGTCPPGLAKKNNGCMPPGQAKKWLMGRPLPPDLVFHELPAAVLVQLGPPPPGHRFIRVDSDILLLAIGTGMVVDALQNLTGN